MASHRQHGTGTDPLPSRIDPHLTDIVGHDDRLAATYAWRRHDRLILLESAVAHTQGLPWSFNVFDALAEELHVDDALEELLGQRLRDVALPMYPQAVALALVLRHSWRADDFGYIVRRLGLSGG